MSFLTVPQAVTLLDDRDPPPKIKKAFLKGLYAAQKDLSAWQCVPRWPAESQVLPETVKHIRSVPGEPEVFYEPTGTLHITCPPCTRSMSYKKRVIRNKNWTSPIFGSILEQTSPFFLE